MPDQTDEEWIFTDISLLEEVVAPSLRLAIKLQHDEHRVLSTADFRSNSEMWNDINEATKTTVICHENDERWRESILNNAVLEKFIYRYNSYILA